MAKMLGKVNLLGLNSLGQNPGMSPLWGAAIGGGTAGGATIILRRVGNANPEAWGLGAGLAISGALYAMRSTRHAAVASGIGAFLAAGISLLDRVLLPKMGLGMASVRPLNGLGIPMARQLNGLGIPQVNAVTAPVGVAGNQLSMGGGLSSPPVSLLGMQTAAGASLMRSGGPQIHGLSASYGANLLGGGR